MSSRRCAVSAATKRKLEVALHHNLMVIVEGSEE
jgi:hypothetical protein